MSTFQPGQVWTYHTRPGEEASRLTVLKVDWDSRVGTVVHIAVNGVGLKCPNAPRGIVETVSHLPMNEEVLNQSVVQLVASDAQLPPYEDTYNNWRRQFEKGESGAFSISLIECLQGLENALSSTWNVQRES